MRKRSCSLVQSSTDSGFNLTNFECGTKNMYGTLGGYFLIKNSLLNDLKDPTNTKFEDSIIRDKSYDFLGSYNFGNYLSNYDKPNYKLEDYQEC